MYVSWFARAPISRPWENACRPRINRSRRGASETSRDASGDKAFLTAFANGTDGHALSCRPWTSRSQTSTACDGLHDLVQEWTEDFNAVLVTGESRADGARDRSLFAEVAPRGPDFQDYGAFMRYAFRGSLDLDTAWPVSVFVA